MPLRPLAGPSGRHAAQILFEDRGILIVNKQAGMDSQSLRRHIKDACSNRLQSTSDWIGELSTRAHVSDRLKTVHRLDKNTTGAFVLAKNLRIAQELSRQFTHRTVDKVYLAIVLGPGQLTSFGRRGHLRTTLAITDGRVSVARPGEDNRIALSDWDLVATSAFFPELSLVRLKLLTGFKHQLRVQLAAELRTPVLGDHLYGRNPVAPSLSSILHGQLFLHASHLAIDRHERSGRRLRLGVTAPVPESFAVLCDQAGLPLSGCERRGGLFIDNALCDLEPGDPVPRLDGTWLRDDLELPRSSPPLIPRR